MENLYRRFIRLVHVIREELFLQASAEGPEIVLINPDDPVREILFGDLDSIRCVAIGLCDNEDEARGLVTAPMESDNSTASSPSHASALTPDPASAPAPVSTPAPMPSPTPQDDPDITFPAPLDSISNIGNIDMPIDIDEELPFN